MSTAELKLEIIDKINHLENDDLLGDVLSLLNIGKEDSIYRLSDEQRKDIREAITQYERGEFVTAEDANKELDEWLSEE